MGLSAVQSSAVYTQLALWFTLALWVILLAFMGAVNGLKFRRIPVRHGVDILWIIRGEPARIIGGFCVLLEVVGAGLLINYLRLLTNFCGTNAGCFVTTPLIVLSAWPILLFNALVVGCFILWLRGRHTDIAPHIGTFTYSFPTVYHGVNSRLAIVHERSMNRHEVEQIMAFVEQQAPLAIRNDAEQVMDGKRPNAKKLAAVLLTDARFREKGRRVRVAVGEVTDVYVRVKQPR
jgi:hypothetical protein